MTHLMDFQKKKKERRRNVLFFVSNPTFPFDITSHFPLSLLPRFCFFLPPCHFILFYMNCERFVRVPAALSHTHYISLSLRAFFIYIMAGLDECRNDCVQGERDNSYLYSYLGRIQ